MPPAARFDRNLAGARLAVDRTCDFAVDQHDALVAFRDGGKEGLGHEGLAPDMAEQLGQRSQIGSVAADAEYAVASVAVKRLQYDLAMLGMKRLQFGQRAGDQGRRHEVREIEHEQLSRAHRGPHAGR